MNESLIEYLQRLELLAFFSGYPLVYAVVVYFFRNRPATANLLPVAYAITGTLYVGLQIKNLYPRFAVAELQHPLLVLWACLSLLFFLPVLSKKKYISLLHSLVFFYFLVKDIFLQLFSSATDRHVLQNDMKIYTDSLLVNVVGFILSYILHIFFIRVKRR